MLQAHTNTFATDAMWFIAMMLGLGLLGFIWSMSSFAVHGAGYGTLLLRFLDLGTPVAPALLSLLPAAPASAYMCWCRSLLWARHADASALLSQRCLDLPAVTIAVPPALPACLAVSVAFAVARLRAQDIFVSSPDKINYAGQIDMVSPPSVSF